MTLHDDELLNEIGEALSVDPGPAFGAGVHARIRRSRQRRFARGGALALAASAVLAVLFGAPGLQPQVGRPTDVPAPGATFGAPGRIVGAPGLQPRWDAAAPVATVGTAPAATVNASRGVNFGAPGLQPRWDTAAQPVTAEPPVTREYVVVTNQLQVLNALWAQHQGQALLEVALEAAVPEVPAMSEDPRRPIVIEPVRVLPVVIGDPERLPAAPGVPIIRRAIAAAETR